MMMPEALSSTLSNRPHPLDLPPGGLPMSIACSSSSMFPPPGMLKLDKSVYSSPPPAANTPENNCCKLIDYRGHKVAAFNVDRKEMICLPQAFELFLKHLVGGLHTVYTKLKRLGITPVVCNVEQVRILRGLGAIQPGVNRCKLIGPKEFDVLYDDCTNSSARPGRPPKRSSPSPDKSDESPFRAKQQRIDDVPGYPHYKWMDIMKSSPLFGNGYYYPHQMAAHLPFMPHPAMVNMAMNGHLPSRPNGLLDIPKDLSSPIKDFSHDRSKMDDLSREKNNNTHLSQLQADGDKPLNLNTRDFIHHHHSRNDDSGASCSDHDDLSDVDLDLSSPSPAPSDRIQQDEESENSRLPIIPRDNEESHDIDARSEAGNDAAPEDIPGPGSMVALLLNLQGLLRMAIETAKLREQKFNSEKAELKRDVCTERERRQHLETQLDDTQKTIAVLEKKLKREKKLLRRLQDSSAPISCHMTTSHMTQSLVSSAHMPVFPHPTTQPISMMSSHSESTYSSPMSDNRVKSHSVDVKKQEPEDDDDSEVPRATPNGINGHKSPLHDDTREGHTED